MSLKYEPSSEPQTLPSDETVEPTSESHCLNTLTPCLSLIVSLSLSHSLTRSPSHSLTLSLSLSPTQTLSSGETVDSVIIGESSLLTTYWSESTLSS